LYNFLIPFFEANSSNERPLLRQGSFDFGCALPKNLRGGHNSDNNDFQPIAQTTGEIETWLAKQSDLCRSKGKTVAGEKLWVGVPTQETKHVSDLIANQKSSKE